MVTTFSWKIDQAFQIIVRLYPICIWTHAKGDRACLRCQSPPYTYKKTMEWEKRKKNYNNRQQWEHNHKICITTVQRLSPHFFLSCCVRCSQNFLASISIFVLVCESMCRARTLATGYTLLIYYYYIEINNVMAKYVSRRVVVYEIVLFVCVRALRSNDGSFIRLHAQSFCMATISH